MKTLKLLFVVFLFSTVFTSCSATATADDDQLYVEQQAQFTGGDTAADIDTERN